jgi:hypothetical protein
MANGRSRRSSFGKDSDIISHFAARTVVALIDRTAGGASPHIFGPDDKSANSAARLAFVVVAEAATPTMPTCTSSFDLFSSDPPEADHDGIGSQVAASGGRRASAWLMIARDASPAPTWRRTRGHHRSMFDRRAALASRHAFDVRRVLLLDREVLRTGAHSPLPRGRTVLVARSSGNASSGILGTWSCGGTAGVSGAIWVAWEMRGRAGSILLADIARRP